MAVIRTPAKHFAPLAIGAPDPFRALPVRLERMIHFIPPHNEKIRAKLKDTIKTVDVVLGNLEDAIAVGEKEAARKGLRLDGAGVRLRQHGPVDAHQLPELAVDARRCHRDRGRCRQQARCHHAAQGRGAVGHPLSGSAAGPARSQAQGHQADPHPRHSGNRRGREERRGHRCCVTPHARHELGPRRSRGLTRHEDHARRRRPPRLRRIGRSQQGRRHRAHSTSRTSGTTRSAKWSTPASPTA